MSTSEIEIFRRDRDRRILRLPEVERRTGLKHSAIYDGVAAGTFPAPVPITDHAVGWLDSEIDNWIEARIAARAERMRSVATEPSRSSGGAVK